jgi:hypothetical protein
MAFPERFQAYSPRNRICMYLTRLHLIVVSIGQFRVILSYSTFFTYPYLIIFVPIHTKTFPLCYLHSILRNFLINFYRLFNFCMPVTSFLEANENFMNSLNFRHIAY